MFEKQYQYFQIIKIFSYVEKDIYAELVTYFQSCKIYAERETNLTQCKKSSFKYIKVTKLIV